MIGLYTLSTIAEPLQGVVLGADVEFSGVSTDTRTLRSGDLFVALQGPNFDGHDYLGMAQELGAVAALVSAAAAGKGAQSETKDFPVLRVADTQIALGLLGAENRSRFTGRVVGITGSSGKTTVKNMLAAILASVGATLATAGNLNNEIGVPQTLLQLEADHGFAVVEMGAAKAGDIEYLRKLVRPQVGVLLNAMPAHLQGFGSVDDVARAKAEILQDLGAGATAVFNADSEYADLWQQLAATTSILDFGFSSTAAVHALAVVDGTPSQGAEFTLVTPSGSAKVQLPMSGRHNIANALAAAAAAEALGIEVEAIARGLNAASAESGRQQATTAASGATIIDDTYNANPGSVRAAIDVLVAAEGKRVLILGDMGELGAESAQLHHEIGAYAQENGVDELWLTGDAAAAAAEGYGSSAHFFAEQAELINALANRFDAQHTVLVKGSRSMRMEKVSQFLLGTTEGAA